MKIDIKFRRSIVLGGLVDVLELGRSNFISSAGPLFISVKTWVSCNYSGPRGPCELRGGKHDWRCPAVAMAALVHVVRIGNPRKFPELQHAKLKTYLCRSTS